MLAQMMGQFFPNRLSRPAGRLQGIAARLEQAIRPSDKLAARPLRAGESPGARDSCRRPGGHVNFRSGTEKPRPPARCWARAVMPSAIRALPGKGYGNERDRWG